MDGVTRKGAHSWALDVRCQRGGKVRRKRLTFYGNRKAAQRKWHAVYRELSEQLHQVPGSLTAYPILRTFGEVLQFYHDRKGYGTMWSTFDKLKADLGAVANEEMGERFERYVQILGAEVCETTNRTRKASTVNRYAACAKRAYAYALKRKMVHDNPITFYEPEPEEPRDRVLSADEEKRLLAALLRCDSYLYWPVVFSLHNPIRLGDLRALTWENLDETKPWVHFYASKTRRKQNRETCLPFLEPELLEHFVQLRRDHPDNPYLFPAIRRRCVREKGRVVGTEVSHIGQMGCIKKHWASVLDTAKVTDFHWHDLKHCAITWMLDSGFSERDLKNLGVQFTDAMIDRYYKHDASKVLVRWQRRQVDGETVHLVVHSAGEGAKSGVSA